MKRDEERARKMWRDIGVAAMQHGPNSLHHHQPSMYGGPGNGSGAPNNPHWNQPGYRNSYSLPHPTSQNGALERNGGIRGVDGVGNRYQHYDVKPLSQAPSFPEISSASYNGNGYHHPHHNHHHLHQQQQQQQLPPHHAAGGHHGLKPPRPLSMYELSNGYHNGGSSSPQLHSLPPNFVPHQTRNGNGRSPPPLVIHNNSSSPHGGGGGIGPRSPVGHAEGGGGGVGVGGGGRALLQQPEELTNGGGGIAVAVREKIDQTKV
uniref:Uncharacterized protein n=1 Tax=Anopheles epiroticus TaxID=199890 RepID=A0A182PIX2_9DIPT